MTENEKRKRRCCFTGHRPEKMYSTESEIKASLALAIEDALAAGKLTFISGMSRGVDIWAAELVLQYREANSSIHLICAIPHPDFEKRWSPHWQQRYRAILQEADVIRTISTSFSMSSYQIRNELERQGIVSDRCEMNRQIKADNALLRVLKQTLKNLTEAVKNSLSDIADALETIRSNIMILYYEVRCVRADKDVLSRKLKSLRNHLTKRTHLNDLIKAKEKEHKALLAEKKGTSALQVSKQKDLTRRISAVAEELEELRSEKAFILREAPRDTDINTLRTEATAMENQLDVLTRQEKRYSTELDDTFQEYDKMREQAVEFDYDALMIERMRLRPDKEQVAISRVESAYGEKYRPMIMEESSHDVATVIDEKEKRNMQQLLRQKQNEQTRKEHKNTSRGER